MPRFFPPALALAAIALAGCSSQQLYAGGQAAQRAECNKLSDLAERQRCLDAANRPHDSYEREAAAARQPAR